MEAKTITQTILRSCNWPLFAFGGIIANIVEITVASMILAYIGMLINHNLQFVQEHQFLLIPLVDTAFFLVLALPGFFTVIFLSKLAGQNRTLGAIVLAVTGALVWLAWSAFSLAVISGTQVVLWVIRAGFISNALGQVLAAILIGRKQSKKDSLAPVKQ